MSRLNQVIPINLAGLPESTAALSDLWSNLPRLTTWVSRALLSPDGFCSFMCIYGENLFFLPGQVILAPNIRQGSLS